MVIETKYNIGDVVWHISRKHTYEFEKCEFCDGDGTVFGKNDVSMRCSECRGDGGHRVNHKEPWTVIGTKTIGEVGYKTSKHKTEERYMAVETGIGSGSVYYVDQLYPTEELAQAECDRRNSEPQGESK